MARFPTAEERWPRAGEVIKEKMFFLENLEKELKSIEKEIIEDCVKSLENIDYDMGNNYQVFTRHHDKLYSLFIESCKKKFNNFTIKNSETKLWANYTDENYNPNQSWHNHETSCTLCGVLYLETVENCGIKLKHDNQITYIEPKKYDLLVFPGFLNHLPIVHKTKKRISLQFEISCIEDINNIWSQK